MPDSPENQIPQIDPQPTYSQLSPLHVSDDPGPASNSKVVKAVLITVAVFVGLGVLGLGAVGFGTWYFARGIHRVPSATFSEAELGIAIYPGAEPSLNGTRSEIGGKAMVNGIYFTRDSADQVIAFYREKAGPKAQFTTTAGASRFRISLGGGGTTTVTIMRIPDPSGGLTSIRIVHLTQIASR
jgi:hypothetical protein